jgi:hypothetical protein
MSVAGNRDALRSLPALEASKESELEPAALDSYWPMVSILSASVLLRHTVFLV